MPRLLQSVASSRTASAISNPPSRIPLTRCTKSSRCCPIGYVAASMMLQKTSEILSHAGAAMAAMAAMAARGPAPPAEDMSDIPCTTHGYEKITLNPLPPYFASSPLFFGRFLVTYRSSVCLSLRTPVCPGFEVAPVLAERVPPGSAYSESSFAVARVSSAIVRHRVHLHRVRQAHRRVPIPPSATKEKAETARRGR